MKNTWSEMRTRSDALNGRLNEYLDLVRILMPLLRHMPSLSMRRSSRQTSATWSASLGFASSYWSR